LTSSALEVLPWVHGRLDDHLGGSERERLALLEAHRDAVRERLTEMEHHLELIDYKSDVYREKV
jgi:hypothetical protein